MTHEEAAARDTVYLFLQETSEIFNLLKKYSILIEQKLPGNKAPIHAANELKSLVFHLYNTTAYPQHAAVNMLEAKEHLCRAFYDLHDIIITVYIEGLRERLKPFKATTIAGAFPEYGSIIRPEVRRIQEAVRDARGNRNTDVGFLNTEIPNFSAQIQAMEKFDSIVESMKPDMYRFEQEKKEEALRSKVWDIAKLIIGAAIGVLITLFITNKQNHTKPEPNAPAVQTPK